jgi:hypothetical protein
VLEPGGMKTDWAGASMTIPPISDPYRQTVGQLAEMLRTYSGQEPSEPTKVVAPELTLAERDDAPLRMLIGPDAVEYAAKAAEVLAAPDQQWRDFSVSTTA